jgi:hypothetical protein
VPVKRRRDPQVFSLSFLDCICCGFGAVILLLVLSKTSEPVVLERSTAELLAIIAKLEEERFEIVGDTKVLEREVTTAREQLSEVIEKIARLQGDLSAVQGQYAASKLDSSVQNRIEGRLASARQSLSEEMRRLLGSGYRRAYADKLVGGIPVDSEYIIFVIDTSGSMQRNSWRMVVRKLSETLRIHPKVKGIQVLNDMGDYMFSRYAGRWIPDSPARRREVMRQLASWRPFSNSSPVEGITRAIRSFYDPDKKISIYVFGDDFMGLSVSDVVRDIDNLNRVDEQGNPYVRIHAIGFPMPARLGEKPPSVARFANLMRILCERNGGTFVGLSNRIER